MTGQPDLERFIEEQMSQQPGNAKAVQEISAISSIQTLNDCIDSLYAEIDNLDGYLGPISVGQSPSDTAVAPSANEGVRIVDDIECVSQRIRDARDRIVDIKMRAKI